MIDVTRVQLAIILDIHVAPIAHIFLRNVEHVPIRIMRRYASERTIGRPLQPFHTWVVCTDTIIDRLGFFDLNAKMIETGMAAGGTSVCAGDGDRI